MTRTDMDHIVWSEAGNGEPLFLLHAFPLDHRMWDGATGGLAQTFRVICPNWRGFGAGLAPARLPRPHTPPRTLADYADDVIALCDYLSIERFFVAGCSVGGYVLFELLKKWPERIRAAAFIDSRPEADSAEGKDNRRKLNSDLLSRDEAAARSLLAERMLPRLLGETTRARRPLVVEQVRNWILQAPVAAVVALSEAMALRPDHTQLLDDVAVPVLVASGDEDGIIPATASRQFANGLPFSQLEIIPGAGHLPSVETPELLTEALLSFFSVQL